jgi:hypothetical protein
VSAGNRCPGAAARQACSQKLGRGGETDAHGFAIRWRDPCILLQPR